MTNGPFRLGIVGCGWIAGRHARAAGSLDRVSLVACADACPGVAEAWADEHGCERAYPDCSAMVRDHELDGVVVATWPNFHREQVLACLGAGIRNVLCEKSLALTGPEALEILAAARTNEALVTEGFMYRHHPAIVQLDELIQTGTIGTLDHVAASFDLFDPEEAAPDDPERDWRQDPERGGGVPWDLVCYCVDACNRFAGAAPVRALALTGRSHRYGTIDRLHGLIEYENGVVGHVRSTRRADSSYGLTLAGTEGRLQLPVAWIREGDAEVLLTTSSGWAEFESRVYPVTAADSFTCQLETFVAAARGERDPIPTLDESVVTAFTLDALLSSGAEAEVVEIELPAEVAA
jgi:D-xylose 1-dehydrogenase (NADP+, D-xylono-1,5-lactone-forming)